VKTRRDSLNFVAVATLFLTNTALRDVGVAYPLRWPVAALAGAAAMAAMLFFKSPWRSRVVKVRTAWAVVAASVAAVLVLPLPSSLAARGSAQPDARAELLRHRASNDVACRAKTSRRSVR
jgi:hypothetical protein